MKTTDRIVIGIGVFLSVIASVLSYAIKWAIPIGLAVLAYKYFIA